MRKYFGTDGVRGVANVELTCDLAFKLGRAGGYVLGNKYASNKNERIKVIVGKDTRISGDMLEASLTAGLMSAGCDVILAGVIPTPGVAFLTRAEDADLGVVISASHNPAEYNGIKFFNHEGFKLDDDIEKEIEYFIDSPDEIDIEPSGVNVGRKNFLHRAQREYIDFIKEKAGHDLSGLKVVLDCANGASYKIAGPVFEELGAEVIITNAEPDGININEKCGSTHPEGLKKAVVEHGADMGMAYDGDADRLIAVDENGDIVDGDKIMILSAIDLKEKGKLKDDTLVVTVMSNMGLTVAAKNNKINLSTTSVGDRYVLERMREKDYSLGGEQSGHLIFLEYNTTGDGVLSSVVLASIAVEKKEKLSKLASKMEVFPQVLVNTRVDNDKKNSYNDYPEVVDAIEAIEKKLLGEGRVLIRPSGTEPLVRVMIEGKEIGQIEKMANELAELISSKLI